MVDSTKEVFVTNESAEQGKHATKLTLERLSSETRAGGSFTLFQTTLISGLRVVNNGNTAILDRQGVKVYKN